MGAQVTESPTIGECVYGDVQVVDGIVNVFDGSSFTPVCSHYFANGYLHGGNQVCQKLGYAQATVTSPSGSISDETAFFVGDCWQQTFPDCTDQWSECTNDLASTTYLECEGQSEALLNGVSCI